MGIRPLAIVSWGLIAPSSGKTQVVEGMDISLSEPIELLAVSLEADEITVEIDDE